MMKTVQREDYLRKLRQLKDVDLIKIVTGVRRSGKSTLLELFRNELIKSGIDSQRIIALNFEEVENEPLLDRHKLYHYIEDRLVSDRMNYIFLDEVQNIPEYEVLVDSLYVKKNVDIYITGSNAFLQSSELATLLSGRYIEISILPFSFAEFVSSFSASAELSRRYDQYVNYSSFPQAVSMIEAIPDQINNYLRGIYESVVTKDVMTRREIKSRRNFDNVVRFILDSIGSAVSPSSIATAMTANSQSIKHTTVDGYLSALVNSFVLYKAERWDIKGKKLLATQEKYYTVDLGLRRVLLGRQDGSDRGHLLENVIYLELLRRGGEIYIGKTGNREVDFVVKSPSGDLSYYQVAYSVATEETLTRELTPLRQIDDNYPKYLITLDQASFDNNGIRHLNALDFLMNQTEL